MLLPNLKSLLSGQMMGWSFGSDWLQ